MLGKKSQGPLMPCGCSPGGEHGHEEERLSAESVINKRKRKKTMVIDITPEELVRMKGVLLDSDGKEALVLIKEFVKRIEQQKNAGMKFHLGGQ